LRAVILGARCSVEVEDIRRLVYAWQRVEEVHAVRAVADAATYRINAQQGARANDAIGHASCYLTSRRIEASDRKSV
jgi:hypothetical protein